FVHRGTPGTILSQTDPNRARAIETLNALASIATTSVRPTRIAPERLKIPTFVGYTPSGRMP
ncbi:MAG: hypothetical protein NT169_29210, partial [Chloroflexi bacterium]|nr:hypothetical protein [Chloroflexota bacterium]